MNEHPLADAVRAGDRRALSRAITLVESERHDQRAEAAALLDEILPSTGGSTRVAVTGSPGAGKSTLIESLGLHLIEQGHRVAVLAIDPSSKVSRGSILGDKTRMLDLGRDPRAFIRPSPSGGTLGGVARRTREALLLCEAAGYDIGIIETVGVGQSETAASDMVDCSVLVVAPGGGDELQGIKRGIMELADVVVVNKADGDLLDAAMRAVGDLRTALQLMPPRLPGWTVPVLPVSAVGGTGLPEVWGAVEAFVAEIDASLGRTDLRGEQAVRWMRSEVRSELVAEFEHRPGVTNIRRQLEQQVRVGELSPTAAAQRLLQSGHPSC